MSEAISAVVDASIKALAAEANKGLKAFHEQVTSSLVAAHENFRIAAASGARRTDLLWWRHSLYSSSLAQGYRQVPTAVAAVFMAIDVHHQVGPITPISVEFFLREAVRETLGETSVSLAEVLAQIKSRGYADNLAKLVQDVPQRDGVKTLVEKLIDDINSVDRRHDEKIKEKKVKKDNDIELHQFAVKVFLALQSLRLVGRKSDERKV